jgi:hypothetical protein
MDAVSFSGEFCDDGDALKFCFLLYATFSFAVSEGKALTNGGKK